MKLKLTIAIEANETTCGKCHFAVRDHEDFCSAFGVGLSVSELLPGCTYDLHRCIACLSAAERIEEHNDLP